MDGAGRAVEDRLHVHDRRPGRRRRVRADRARRRLPAAPRRALGRLRPGRHADGRPGRRRPGAGRAHDRLRRRRRAAPLRHAHDRGRRASASRSAPAGTYVAVLRGYPEDSAVGVSLGFADRRERHNFGASRDTTAGRRRRAGVGGPTATRWARAGAAHGCARRAPTRGARPRGRWPARRRRPPAWACAAPSATGSPTPARSAPATAGVPGFDRWDWLDPARAHRSLGRQPRRERHAARRSRCRGADAPRKLTITRQGAFLDRPAGLRRPAQAHARGPPHRRGASQRGRPGEGLTPDPVESRRPR